MRTALHGFLLLLCMFCAHTEAFHVQANILQSPFTQRQVLQQVYFQLTPASTSVDDLLADPQYYHSFRPLGPQQQLFFNAPDAVWLFARIENPASRAIEAVIEYDFPLADKIEIYQVNRQNQDFSLLSRTGNDYPYRERPLPVRSFAISLSLSANEAVDLYFKVQDAAVVPTELLIWQYDNFIGVKQRQAMVDGVLVGFLLLLTLYNVLLYARGKVVHYLYYAGFFLSFAMVVAVLNGMAFALLWPDYPEVNQAILYISAGSSLLCLNMVVRYAIQSRFGFWWQSCSYTSNAMALLLLFSPLFADGQLRLYLLFFTVSWVLGANLLVALRISTQKHPPSQVRGVVWSCLFILFSALLLTLNQSGYLQADIHWSYIMFALLLLGLAVTAFTLFQFKLSPLPGTPDRTGLQYYHDIFQNAVEGMFVTTRDGRLLDANPALIKILGYQTLAQLKQAIAGTGMTRFYANHTEQQRMLKQLESADNNSIEIRGLRADNSPFWALMSVRLTASTAEKTALVHGCVIDITQQKLASEQLAYQATHDALTTLPNRFYFNKQLQTVCEQTTTDKGCVLYLDIDQFSLINANCGYRAGDALLIQLSSVIKRVVDHHGVTARLEHDKFAILLEGKTANQSFSLAYRLLDAVRAFRFIWQQQVYPVSLGIGVAELAQDDKDGEEVLKKADIACRIAKEKGQNRIQLFNFDKLDRHNQSIVSWLDQLRQALQHDLFVLYQQSVQALAQSGAGQHYELLLRLHSDAGSPVNAANFLATAEHFGLMPKIDRWVIRHYFRWLQQHPAHLAELSLCHINLSGHSLADTSLIEDIQQLFERYQIPPAKICFEFTESAASINSERLLAFINYFRPKGCKIALDDFGSGFFSFSGLKHLPLDFVKIDGHFIRALVDDKFDNALVQSIQSVVQTKHVLTVAEEVESEDILAALQRTGIDFAQGYIIAKPMPLNGLVS